VYLLTYLIESVVVYTCSQKDGVVIHDNDTTTLIDRASFTEPGHRPAGRPDAAASNEI